MGSTKLCVLLLLASYTLAQQEVGRAEEQSPACFLAKRFKNFRRFVYDYEAETFTGVNGHVDKKSGPKVSCRVEIDVPQTCSFVLRTSECALSEIYEVDHEGNTIYRPAAGAEAFRDAMARNPLKITVEGEADVKLYPEGDEPVNILNIKRGIVSALMMPMVEEEMTRNMPTVHGACPTDFVVNTREEAVTDVTINRDLSRCDMFYARRQSTSPMALITGMNFPLSKMISSTQTCNYNFDNKKHISRGVCTETHMYMPLPFQKQYGMSTLVKQTVTLRETAKINDRVFQRVEDNVKPLYMDVVEDKVSMQTKDAAMTTFRQLMALSPPPLLTQDREERPMLFYKLVSELRGLKTTVLQATVDEMMESSEPLAWQALVQCGTPECTSTMLAELRKFDKAALEVDAAVYALGLLPNPSRVMVKDMLAMAQYKQSNPIMYALSNVVRRLYQTEGVTPEIVAVSEFITSILGEDCAGDKDLTFLTLRVVGNMGDALEAANPNIKTVLTKCMRQPATTLAVQLAAIQAFRRMPVTDEVRSNLQRVSLYPKGAVQKRLAAYLMLMKNPQDSDIDMVKKLLKQEQNVQVKSFVTSHIYNIITSTETEVQKLGQRIVNALQGIDIAAHSEYTTKSRSYKLGVAHENMEASIQGSVIFDPSSQLPREALLDTTLKAFGYSMDIWEVGMQGKGFEPSVEALFGKNGFFPDTLSKTLYWTIDKLPRQDMWYNMAEGVEVPENLMSEITRNFNKLLKDLQSQESPEAMAYLRIMGAELGYIKASDLKFIAENAKMYTDIFMRILPTKVLANLMSSTTNEIFAHYIFMDNRFMMPTASGLPLAFAMSGTFTPGAKGGLRLSPRMNQLVFQPSVGIEFVTKMGVNVPEFVESAVEMHTSMFHESALNAKITMENNEVKLSIPAPEGTTRLFSMWSRVMVAGAGMTTEIQHTLGDKECKPLFSGIKYCTEKLRGRSTDGNLYFLQNRENKFEFDIRPTGEVSEYTASIAYRPLTEGKDGRQKVDSVKFALRAEGAQSTEATLTMKYNRNRNVFTAEVEIPEFDVEAGVRVGMTDSASRGKSITFEISNKNVPQLSLIGRAKAQPGLADGMVQVQLLIPSLKTDATVTANMRRTDGVALEIKSDVKLPETSSIQTVTFLFSDSQAEVQLMSNMNADTKNLVFYTEAFKTWLGHFAEDVMDQKVVKTDMKLRHIFNKAVEAGNNWMDKITSDVPYVEILKNRIEEMEMPTMPENLFMNFESAFRYQFNSNRLAFTIPLPLGGKSSEELRMPSMVASPRIFVPALGLEFDSQEIQIPTFTIPSEYDLTLPLMGMVEGSAKVNSNYYNWEGAMSAGNNTADSPNFVAKFNILANSPIKFLTFSTQGITELKDTEEENMKFTMEASLKHMLMTTGFSVLETIAVTEGVTSKGKYNVYANSPLGVDTTLTVNTQLVLDSAMLSGEINTDGSVLIGPMSASTTYLYTFALVPAKREARLESTLNVNSEILKHTTKMSLNYNNLKLTMQSNSLTNAYERTIRSNLELSAFDGQATLRFENHADDLVNRASSVLTASVNPSGLEINTDVSLNVWSSLATHKATLALNNNGLTTSSTTNANYSPMTFENVFHGGVDASGATLSLTTKGSLNENKAELTFEGKLSSQDIYVNGILKGNLFEADTVNRLNIRLNEDGLLLSNSIVGSLNEMKTENANTLFLTLSSLKLHFKTDNVINMKNSYKHDITVDMQPFSAYASVAVKNNLKIMEVSFDNDAQFKAERYNVQLTGTITGTVLEQVLKNTYEVKFVDMVLSTKCNTNGILLGVRVTHDSDMELVGLNMKTNNVFKVNSPNLNLDSTIKTMAAPFTLNIDAVFNSNGAVSLYGDHSGDLYSKFLLEAEPLLFTHSLEYRASTTHDIGQRPTIKTSMENTFNSMLSIQEQSVSLKMVSKVNENTFNQEMSAFNNAERMGIEMMGVASTALFSDASEDYALSGFVKYDKNSDSHFIQIPYMEHLPEILENVKTTLMRLMDQGIELMKDMDTRYEISFKIQSKVSELKEVISNFDFNLLVQNLRRFSRSFERFVAKMTAKFPTDKVMEVLTSMTDIVMAWIRKYNIANNLAMIHAKIEEILSSYEVEKMIETIIDEIVKVMKQYHVREHIQNVLTTLREIDIEPLVKRSMVPFQRVITEVQSFNFKQLIDDMSVYFMGLIQQIKSFDYDTFTIELKENIRAMSKIPAFGKLYGEFRVTAPHYKLRTTADLENITTTSVTPEFKMNFNSQATSSFKILEYTVDASAHVAAPKMNRLTISENVNVVQSSFAVEHKGTMTIYGLSAQASAETTANAKTEFYVGQIINKASFAIESGVSANVETHYKQNVNMPVLNFFTEATMDQRTIFVIEDGTARLTVANVGNGKYALRDLEDEATHKSDMEVAMDFHTAKVTFTGETGNSNYKMSENVVAEICIFRHIIFEAKIETETPFMRSSIAEAKLQAKIEDLRIDFAASHNTELLGLAEGIVSNSVTFLLMPIEVAFDTKNNAKVGFPFIMSGKVDLQNDMTFTVSTEVQRASWTGLARLNQYKYSHLLSMDNGDREINLYSEIKGEANLDVLKVPITIPEITLPLVNINIPEMDFSLWEDAGLSYFLLTTEQTFDMNYKLKYVKNPEMITFDINVEPLITAINTNIKTLHKKFLIGKDQAAAMMVASFDKARVEYERYSIELPKTITVPAYKVPMINVEMSTFTIPLPDFSLITMPSLHVPSALSKLTLPKVTLPTMTTISFPLMGDLTSEFSLKTAMITLKTDASILNQDNFIVTFDASSSSECKCMNGEIKGNANVDTSKGLKLVSALFVKHLLAEGNHQSTIVLNYDNVATSLTNSAKLLVADPPMEIVHEVTGNPEEGLVVAVSSPSAGLIAVQMQTKSPAQVKARLYGRYPSEPRTDIEIIGVKMSMINFEKLNLQTTWNMEMPFEMMLRMKNQVPVVMETVYEPAVMTYRKLYRSVRSLEGSVEHVKENVKTVIDMSFDRLAAVRRSNFVTTLTDNTISVLKVYQKRVEMIMGAVVKFLRETKFLIPGYEDRLSGLEIYQKFTTFVADVSEEAIVKVPEYFTSMSTIVIDYIRSIEFTLPGSNYVVRGGEILDDMFVALGKIQNQMIVTLRKLSNIKLEDMIIKFNAFMQFTVEQTERFFQTLKSENVERFSIFVSDTYSDVMNSQVMADVSRQIEVVQAIVMEYFEALRSKLENAFANMSAEQLQSDIQSWIDVLMKRLNTFQNNVIKTLKEKSKSVQPFVRVGDRQMDIDIPLPFVAKFN